MAIVVLGALAFAGSAQACSCVRMAPSEAMQRADAAIIGKLVKVVPRGRLKADYRYLVQHVYKGGAGIRRGGLLSVRSARQSSACGLPHGKVGATACCSPAMGTAGRAACAGYSGRDSSIRRGACIAVPVD